MLEIIFCAIFVYVMYLVLIVRPRNTTHPDTNGQFSEYVEEKSYALVFKKKGPYLKSISHVASLYSSKVNESKHDYQVLSRTAFGVTQSKVVDLGPEVVKFNSGYGVVINGGGHLPYLFFPSELVPSSKCIECNDVPVFFHKKSMIAYPFDSYAAQLCLKDNSLPEYYVENSFLSEKTAKEFYQWLCQ